MKTIYFAGPLFSVAEIMFNKNLSEVLKKNGYSVFLPQEECGDSIGVDIFNICKSGIDKADVVVAILDGTDHDSGTAWECGYAFGKNIPVIGVRTDFRKNGDTGGFNAMLFYSLKAVVENPVSFADDLVRELKAIL